MWGGVDRGEVEGLDCQMGGVEECWGLVGEGLVGWERGGGMGAVGSRERFVSSGA
jgi:hypothetical protein